MPFRFPTPEPIARFDQRVDRAFEPLRQQPAASRIAYLASESAHNSMLWHAIGLGMAVLRPDLRGRAIRLAITLGLESILVNGIIKPVIRRERPREWEVDSHQVRRPRTSSFPSGHASSGAVAATLLSEAMPGGRKLWWSMAGVVALSRIHTRMHHASDVIAGVAIGRLIGLQARNVAVPVGMPSIPCARPAGIVPGVLTGPLRRRLPAGQ